MRILLTGFEPFGGEPVNPSQDLVLSLRAPGALPGGLDLAVAILPVDRTRVARELDAAVRRHEPDVVVGVGQATGRARVELEAVAHNRLEYRGGRDNGGHVAIGQAWSAGRPARLQVRLPLERIAERASRAGPPIAVSQDAGRHLCNAVLFHLLDRHRTRPACFVHVPLLPTQAARRGLGEPGLSYDSSRNAMLAILSALPAFVAAGKR